MHEMKTGNRMETTLGSTIRRQLGSQPNRVFLSRMPAFRTDHDLPDELLVLLDDLDRAEAQANGHRR